jgi:hypothetical protein
MKITILNGNLNGDNIAFDDYLQQFSDRLKSDDHKVTVFDERFAQPYVRTVDS